MKRLKRKPVEIDRSPLKDRPLRHAGQSLDKEIENLIWDRAAPILMGTMFLCAWAAMEWYQWYLDLPPQPVVITAMAGAAVLYCLWRMGKMKRQVRQLRQARDGERAVGEFLERLRELGYQVFHDLIGENFNVDHVIIGPAGVFTVETKTLSKPARGRAEVVYDGHDITVGGFTPDRDPLVQARAQIGWLRTLLQESTGRPFPVRALVVYPGWFVTLKGDIRQRDVLVMNPRQIPAFLGKLSAKLSPEEVKLASYHLSRHIRVGEQSAA